MLPMLVSIFIWVFLLKFVQSIHMQTVHPRRAGGCRGYRPSTWSWCSKLLHGDCFGPASTPSQPHWKKPINLLCHVIGCLEAWNSRPISSGILVSFLVAQPFKSQEFFSSILACFRVQMASCNNCGDVEQKTFFWIMKNYSKITLPVAIPWCVVVSRGTTCMVVAGLGLCFPWPRMNHWCLGEERSDPLSLKGWNGRCDGILGLQ